MLVDSFSAISGKPAHGIFLKCVFRNVGHRYLLMSKPLCGLGVALA